MRKTINAIASALTALFLASAALAGQTHEYLFNIGSDPMTEEQLEFHDELMRLDPGLNSVQTRAGFTLVMSSSYNAPENEDLPDDVESNRPQ